VGHREHGGLLGYNNEWKIGGHIAEAKQVSVRRGDGNTTREQDIRGGLVCVDARIASVEVKGRVTRIESAFRYAASSRDRKTGIATLDGAGGERAAVKKPFLLHC